MTRWLRTVSVSCAVWTWRAGGSSAIPRREPADRRRDALHQRRRPDRDPHVAVEPVLAPGPDEQAFLLGERLRECPVVDTDPDEHEVRLGGLRLGAGLPEPLAEQVARRGHRPPPLVDQVRL